MAPRFDRLAVAVDTGGQMAAQRRLPYLLSSLRAESLRRRLHLLMPGLCAAVGSLPLRSYRCHSVAILLLYYTIILWFNLNLRSCPIFSDMISSEY